MQAGESLQVVVAQPFFATISGMALQGKLRICQPAAQRFGIDAEATSRLGHRHNGHGITPFVWVYKRTRASLMTSRENSGECSRKKDQETYPAFWRRRR
jgi:hypothetical protein